MAKITVEQLKSGRLGQDEMEAMARKQIQQYLEFISKLDAIYEQFNRSANEARQNGDAQAFVLACANRRQAIRAAQEKVLGSGRDG
jgi:hypothetical protein